MEEVAASLLDLGLNELQTKILLTLSRFDYATVKELSKAAGVYRQEVYPVLKDLENLGLVERKIGTPNQYRTMPLPKILEILLKRKTDWMKSTQKRTESLIETMRKRKENSRTFVQEDYEFTLVNGMERGRQLVLEWSRNADVIDMVVFFDDLMIKVNEKFRQADQYKEYSLYKKDVRVRLINNLPSGSPVDRKLQKNFETRHIHLKTPVALAIYDGKKAHLTILSQEDTMQAGIAHLASNHPYFVKMLQSYFDLLWNSATP